MPPGVGGPSTTKPVGMEEWEVLACTLRKPKGSFRWAARRRTEPRQGQYKLSSGFRDELACFTNLGLRRSLDRSEHPCSIWSDQFAPLHHPSHHASSRPESGRVVIAQAWYPSVWPTLLPDFQCQVTVLSCCDPLEGSGPAGAVRQRYCFPQNQTKWPMFPVSAETKLVVGARTAGETENVHSAGMKHRQSPTSRRVGVSRN